VSTNVTHRVESKFDKGEYPIGASIALLTQGKGIEEPLPLCVSGIRILDFCLREQSTYFRSGKALVGVREDLAERLKLTGRH